MENFKAFGRITKLIPEKIDELLKVILPDGNTLTNLIINEPNFSCFSKLCTLIKDR